MLVVGLGAWIIGKERVWIIEVWILHYLSRMLLSVVCVDSEEIEESENKPLIMGDDTRDGEYTDVAKIVIACRST